MKIEDSQRAKNGNIMIREHNIAKINNLNFFNSPHKHEVGKDSMKITSYVSSRRIPFDLKLKRINKGKICKLSAKRHRRIRNMQESLRTGSVEPQIDDLLRSKDNTTFNVKWLTPEGSLPKKSENRNLFPSTENRRSVHYCRKLSMKSRCLNTQQIKKNITRALKARKASNWLSDHNSSPVIKIKNAKNKKSMGLQDMHLINYQKISRNGKFNNMSSGFVKKFNSYIEVNIKKK